MTGEIYFRRTSIRVKFPAGTVASQEHLLQSGRAGITMATEWHRLPGRFEFNRKAGIMKPRDPISHVMTTNVKTVQISQKMSEVLRIVAENQIHHVPVADGQRLAGIISTTDIIRLNITVSNADEWTIERVMKKNLVTIELHDSVRKAAQLLSDGIFHSLPVINKDRHLVGIITSTDLIRYLAKLC